MMKELQTHAPEILQQAQTALADARVQKMASHILTVRLLKNVRQTQFDYAVMEHTDKAAVVAPVDVGWNDIGSWTELPNATENDEKFCCSSIAATP